jgi:hypothetical protein
MHRSLRVEEYRSRMSIFLLQFLPQLVYHLIFLRILRHQVAKIVLQRHLLVPQTQIPLFQQPHIVALIDRKLSQRRLTVLLTALPRRRPSLVLFVLPVVANKLTEPSLFVGLPPLPALPRLPLRSHLDYLGLLAGEGQLGEVALAL